MSDLDKLEKIQGSVNKYVDWAKNNAILVGILTTFVPAVFVGGYQAITELNKAKAALAQFSDMVSNYDALQSKVKSLEQANDNLKERMGNLGDSVIKIQDKTSEALLNARESKIVAESTQKETRAQMVGIKAEVDAGLGALRVEMNALRKASVNPLGR